jgi:hypothetical protein
MNANNSYYYHVIPREKSTVYLFSHGDKYLYTLNDNGICNQWEAARQVVSIENGD